MVDFIEYVVSELKSKRLSKRNAVDLVRQFSHRAAAPAATSVIHPLLHHNTSDLTEQRYSSTFDGEEFFLADHQVKGSGSAGHKVLPGVAYLEMARAAIEHAWTAKPESSVLELHHTVWAQPAVVSGPKEISIALLASEEEQLEFEVYSNEGDQETVHCQGRAALSREPAPAALDLEQLEREMKRGLVEPGALYAECARIGLQYGLSFRAVTAIRRGDRQLLADLQLPDALAGSAKDYVLHPSLMDGALQAAIGLLEEGFGSTQPRLPFALETLRILSPCTPRMVAWVRFAAGSQPEDAVVRIDVDLCDEQGNVCVQMRGVSSRVLTRELAAPVPQGEAAASPIAAPAVAAEPEAQPARVAAVDAGTLAEKTEHDLQRELSELLHVPPHEIDARAALENYGIDSILAMKLTTQLEKTFGSLPKTLFFEYQTLRDLAAYFTESHTGRLHALFATAATERVAPTPAPAAVIPARRSRRSRKAMRGTARDAEPIAIIGLSGRYPEALDVEAYWTNLREGKDCIIEVPKDRWDWREYFSTDRTENGRHYSKWGGFIEGVDEFDPLFFNISPADAEMIDPQERLFLQHAWMAVEDAGYTRAALQVPHDNDLPGQVGVYVGVMYTEYQLFGADAAAQGRRMGVASSASSVANRVSYALNLHGPSMTLDTMCSSSLSAIHIACQDLKEGRTSLAIAGGVNVSIHPNKYLVLSAGQFISSDGHCQSFGEGGDGYIPGEGVGAVVLKRLSEARRDGDHIYGIIRGSALNHGGKTNGYTVPNPQAQATVVTRALAEAHVDPRHVSYIEAHGTGTKLGDPIEIAALSKAFHRQTHDTGFCLIGSSKSNVGHCESAAGIAGLTKILLQMQHRQIAPSLHSARLNPHIDFETTPFVVNQELRPWEQPVIDGRTVPRIAGISSFGAGGSNAHMIIEEVEAPVRQPVFFENVVVILSAKTPERLRQKVQDLLSFVEPRLNTLDLVSLAYTLQVGREAMEERLAFVVSTAAQLLGKLRAHLAGQQRIEDAWRGQVKRNNETLLLFSDDADLQQTVGRWIDQRRLGKLLEIWVKGVDVDWGRLYADEKPGRMSLPVYPFARERYWVDITAGAPVAARSGAVAVLHPLLHSNTSDLSEQRYSTTFTGEEFFLADHQVRLDGSAGDKVLPGVAYLEMARAAIEHALRVQPEGTLELLDTVWLQPIVVTGSRQVSIALLANENDEIDYEIYSQLLGSESSEPVVHCRGRAVFRRESAPAPLDLAQLAREMGEGTWEPARIYAECARMGLMYGLSFQGITSVARGSGQLLASLHLPKTAEASAEAYVLHPSLLDGALQAAVALIDESDGHPRVPFALDSLRLISPTDPEMVAWLRFAPGSGPDEHVVKLDVDLCDVRGNVCVQLRGVSSRALSTAPLRTAGTLLAAPVWQAQSLDSSSEPVDAERHVILCELPDIDAGELATLIPNSECVSLPMGSGRLAQRYTEHAIACFERIQSLMQSRAQRRVLVQIVAAGEGEQAILAGLSGLLRTAALENPRVAGQVLLVPRSTTTEELVRDLRAEGRATEPLVRYENGVRHILGWQEVPVDAQEAPVTFRDDGAYLLTGGLGALGLLFAREILEQTRSAQVVLTGRSPLTAAKQAQLDGLSAHGARVTYRQLDLDDLGQVRQLITSIVEEQGQLNGILHSAGTIADSFILKKSTEDVRAVLAPKVTGTFHLDEASRDVPLDFFVLFSSIAGAMGNPGQADYAVANGFMDHFAAYRNQEVAEKRRHGRTVSMNWPLWQDGGMSVDAARQELLRETTGMQPMQTANGVAALRRALALPFDQVLVVEGELALVRRAMFGGSPPPVETRAAVPAIAAVVDDLVEKTHDFLRKEFSGLLKLAFRKIDPYAALEQYGIDSVLAMKLTNQLEKTFGSLSRTLFFEYQTVHDLAGYFITSHAAQLNAVLSPDGSARTQTAPVPAPPAPAVAKLASSRRFSRAAGPATATAADADPIAIIGLSGRYPEAVDVDAYWENLREGKDCIIEVPQERWDWREYFSEDRSRSGHHFSKWGGFIPGVDEFDPMFFNISGMEAELMDPQERLFLQHAWMAVEDAGYTRAALQVPHALGLPGQVGVYVGVMNTEYQLLAAEASARGKRMGIAGSTASISNRVSYTLNLHGPSVTLDTMCSSSLTAIHFACLDLKLGRTSMALAGGVNVTIHPNKYLVLSAGQFISSDGHCQSFGEGGDGYIPGEGVGVVVLKRLSDAKKDGDHIYGIIRGSALNHGGKTNGYTVPNPQAQAGVISGALAEARVDPRHVSYLEAHGTGTKLGDPIEIAALGKAFRQSTQDSGFCLIGSAKSNIGHCESAAGIAGLTKVLLQMQHGQIVPSLHSSQLNPHIDFETTPFVVNQVLRPWERPVIDGRALPRIAGISSFGAGGSNAHLIVEEYQAAVQETVELTSAAILLSARAPEQLREKAADLLRFLAPRLGTVDLAALAWTLQAGREAMEERLGFIVSSVAQLAEKLEAYLAGEQGIEDVYRGDGRHKLEALSLFSADADLKEAIDKWLAHGKLPKLLELWVNGLEVDWSRLYGETRPPRISLPVYPFAKERYWIDTTGTSSTATASGAVAVLHPLLHSNTSDLNEQRYTSTFTGEEFFLTDHQVQSNGRALKILPGVACLEMARAAIRDAWPAHPGPALLELHNVVWAEPVVVSGSTQVNIALSAAGHEQIDYEIYSVHGDAETVHGQGRALLNGHTSAATLDLQELEKQMDRGQLDAAAVYERCAGAGLLYGPSFRSVHAVRRGKNQLLAQLRLPQSAAGASPDYVLHPSVMDGALQACVALVDDSTDGQPRLPFALDSLRVFAPCTDSMVTWIRYSPGSRAEDSVVKLDIDLCDERGNVCVQLSGLSSRVLGKVSARPQQAIGTLVAAPVWETSAGVSGDAREFAEHHVITCELPELGSLESALPGAHHLPLGTEPHKTIAERYSFYALQCFEQVQRILQSRVVGRVLVQVVVPDRDEQALLAGLSGLLKTAALENPQFVGQLLLVSPGIGSGELVQYLRQEKTRAIEPLVRYENGARRVLRWKDVPAAAGEAPVAFRDQGVYLITGGLGGLGLLFAREILERTRDAKVVLTGRSALTPEKQALLDGLSSTPGRVSYRQVDLGELDQVKRLIAGVQYDHHRLTGILHSAGMTADRFILKKQPAEFGQVLEPKVTGTFHLDQATQIVPLDWFVLFSSVAGALGNLGQADYATANAFMDQFAAHRNRHVAAKHRYGRTLSVNWPLWQSGGMGIDPASRDLLRETTGMEPMQTATGMQAFHRALASPYDQVLVVEGDVTTIRRALTGERPVSAAPAPAAPAVQVAAQAPTDSLFENAQAYLRKEFSSLLKLPAQKIDPQAALEKYGIDSILALELTNRLERTFGSLSKTLFFEYQTIAALAGYFVKAHAAKVREVAGVTVEQPAREPEGAPVAAPSPAPAGRRRSRRAAPQAAQPREIAIVGLAGRYPQAETLPEFWRNLCAGRDCITEIPADRWDHSLYFDPDPNKAGKSYSKWGGFIDDVDKFDPLFFSISPREAAQLDPQERLFLQTAWQVIEDAGYSKESIGGGRVGVYVGMMWGHYELLGAESILRGGTALSSASHASVANRVSYFFDFHGPSIGLDTMCSSSLTAIDLAVDALRNGEIDAAIAGGVNLTVHPYKYLSLSLGRFPATDGRCRSFGEGGDGFVPGEGVGAVLLKPLDHALRDGDQIYAIVRSSAVNHGGKTNGYTVPNPNAQADVVREALKKADIDPATLSYIETHGTGTSLGDPIEIAGLSKAFEGHTVEQQFCPIGSVKSNIGHLESAAGIAAVTKALLQLKHRKLVPSLHADPLNPHIDFANSPFYVQTELADWKQPAGHPRRVGVSSFGAGGSNAHVILEEYAVQHEETSGAMPPEAFLLSARDAAALSRYAESVAAFLADTPGVSLADLAYTSQVGRTPMAVRLVAIASSVEDLRQKLDRWVAMQRSGALTTGTEDVFHGDTREGGYDAAGLIDGAAGKAFLAEFLARRDLEKIARLWTMGVDLDWSLLSRPVRPHRVSLPTYPFAKERYWIDLAKLPPNGSAQPAVAGARRLYYVPEWSPAPLGATVTTGTILVLDASEELSLALRERGASVVWVRPEDSFEELVENLKSTDRLPDVVLHHNAGVQALFVLCKALLKQAPAVMSVFSSGDPLGAAMSGFLKTLALENPKSQTKVVELAENVTGQAALILAELAERDWTAQEIRYQQNLVRYARRFVAIEPKRSALPLKRNGVYLITGGLGGLGIIFAEYLAKSFQAKLVLIGRSAPDAAQQEKIRLLESYGAEVLVLQADVSRLEDLEAVVREAKARFSELNGVIHSAGVNRDAFILRKSREDFEAVLAPKVSGAINVDLATKDENLDCLVFFSSVAAAAGNPGQSDYAYANRFLDAFAESREQRRKAGERSGRTLSILWPLWEEGGMQLSPDEISLMEQRTGMVPLPAQEGIRYFEDFLQSDAVQGVALYGTPSRMSAWLGRKPPKEQQTEGIASAAVDSAALGARTEAYLKSVIGEEISLDPERIGSTDPLESFGLDSVVINRLNARLESDLGPLPKTLFYEHETVRDLAAFLLQETRAALVALAGPAASVDEAPFVAPAPPLMSVRSAATQDALPAPRSGDAEPIAIIGIHGSYPHSPDLGAYWENLKHGKDLVDPIPFARWDAEGLYDPDPKAAADGKIYSKWGAFLEDYDKFDPRFFNISPQEAGMLDPQERLFLESVWAAIEDAGYTRSSLKARFGKGGSANVGVFVGVTTNSYSLWGPEEWPRGNYIAPTAMPWSIANHVSYFFDFNGPSLPIDTACSSSLVALHLACESLRSGDCQVAIAGGVNLYLHPAKYHSLCQRRMLSLDGKCHSYGAGDDGFVPGEGVGTLVLKPLRKAVEDGDFVYAVVAASAYSHSGRSNGYSAPNPNSQASLIDRTLEQGRIHPETIGYVEGHGTGTQLGDSLEIAALTQAFRKQTAKTQFCPIGSVKANLGHSESAAGVAGLAKIILQLQRGQLAPSIHSDEPNPNIEFADSPFYLQHELSDWPSSPDHPRRALINSFGAGGVNACAVLEEYVNPLPAGRNGQSGPYLFVLSAKNEDRLREYAGRLLGRLYGDERLDLASLCYTLQTGREAMEARLAIIVSDVHELADKLAHWTERGPAEHVYRGTAAALRASMRSARLTKEQHSFAELASRWVAGEAVDWESLYSGNPPRRLPLPTYPFARERYWIPDAPAQEKPVPFAAQLHPLIAHNSSTLKEVSFSSLLSDTAFYAADHRVHGQKVFPGAGLLEMACISGNLAGEARVWKIRDVVWIQPLLFRGGPQPVRTALRTLGETVEYVMSSFDDDNEAIVHSEGRLVFGNGRADLGGEEDRVAIADLKAQCARFEDGAAFYAKFSEYGLQYGPAFQTVQELYAGDSFALAKLKIAGHLRGEFGQFILHPALIDGALQAVAGVVGSASPRTPHLPFALDELEILRPLPQTCYAYAERAGGPGGNHAGVTCYNIRLLNESGDVLVELKNLYVRPLPRPLPSDRSLVGAKSGL
jgi:polyketide synthase PksL